MGCLSLAKSQPWLQDYEAPPNSFAEIQNRFEAYWQNRPTKNVKGWKQYRRWEYFWKSRIMPDGSFPSAIQQYEAWKSWKQQQSNRRTSSGLVSNWVSAGPFGRPNNSGAG
ncbi:MAG: hypothetical protein NZ108_11310, partial [Bacteroidia bacterium]|nr:hypothetical protein [Bacteroidia bacterium]